MPRTGSQRRGDIEGPLTVAVVLLFVALVALRFDEAPVGAITDDAIYVEMARSLAEGRGPVLLVGPDAPPANPGVFPPGFPLLLAPLALAFPASLAALKAVPLLAALLLVPLCRRLPAPGVDAGFARPSLLALVLLNPWFVGGAGRILSDLPYTALSLAALLAFERWQRSLRPATGPTLLLALLTGLALLVRSIGLALPLAMAAALVAGRRWRHLLALAVSVAATQAVLLVPGWSGGGAVTAAYREQLLGHSGSPGARLEFVAGNAAGYVGALPVALWPGFGEPARRWFATRGAGGFYEAAQIVGGLLLLGLVVVGWRALHGDPDQRPRARLWLLYLVFVALALVNFAGWPSGVQPRLLLPVMPLLYVLLLGGAVRLTGRAAALVRRRWLAGLCALLLLGSLGHNAWRVARPLRSTGGASGEPWADPGAGAAWLRAQGGPGPVVMAPDALARHIHLRCPVIACGDTLTAAALRRRAATYGATWLVVTAPPVVTRDPAAGAADLAAAIATEPAWFPLRWADSRGATRIHGIRGADAGPGAAADESPARITD